jgi:AraC-like DNA-binding protein
MTDLSLPDRVDCPFLGYSIREPGGSIESHSHQKAQLFYAISGEVVVEFDAASWSLPPLTAAWIPSGAIHASHYAGPAKVGFLYIEPQLAPSMSSVGRPICVSPLLRELLTRMFSEDVTLTPSDSRHVRLFNVLLDEITSIENTPAALRAPRDPRLRRLMIALKKDPGSQMTADAWGVLFGMSQRTLSRLFRKEIGKSFTQVREQFQICHAVRQLETGKSVSNVAFELGYESSSAFIAMFKRNTGETPGIFSARAKLATVNEPSISTGPNGF